MKKNIKLLPEKCLLLLKSISIWRSSLVAVIVLILGLSLMLGLLFYQVSRVYQIARAAEEPIPEELEVDLAQVAQASAQEDSIEDELTLKDCFIDFRKEDAVFHEKDVSLKALKNEAHYFDFIELGTRYLGMDMVQTANEGVYPKKILLNGNRAVLYDDETISTLRMSNDEDILDSIGCRVFTELITVIQGDEVNSYIMARRGDAFYIYVGEPKQWTLDDIVMSGTNFSDDGKVGMVVQLPMMVERETFKVLLKMAKKHVFWEDDPFETLGVEYKVTETDPFRSR